MKGKDMNTSLSMLLSQFAAAWDVFFTVKLPAFFRSNMEEWETLDGQGALTVPMLPVAGAAAGFILFLPLTFICILGTLSSPTMRVISSLTIPPKPTTLSVPTLPM